MGRKNLYGRARLATAAGLGLALALGAAPVVAVADDTGTIMDEFGAGGIQVDTDNNEDSGSTEAPENGNGLISDDRGKTYDSVSAALNDGARSLTLLNDVTENSAITIPLGASVVINLDGHTLSMSHTENYTDASITDEKYKEFSYAIINHGTLDLFGGTVEQQATSGSLILNLGELHLDSSLTVTGSANGYLITNLGGEINSFASIIRSGLGGGALVTYGGAVNINGGQIKAVSEWTNYNDALAGVVAFNRTYNNNGEGAQVYISDGVIVSDIYAVTTNNVLSGGSDPCDVTISGGSLRTVSGSAIYWPSAGTLTVGQAGWGDESVSIIADKGSAIEMCSGALVVNSGTLRGSAEACETDQYLVDGYRANSGSAGPGDAVTLVTRRGGGYVNSSISVTINGGLLESDRNYGLRYFDCNRSTGATKLDQEVDVSVSGGTFVGGLGAVDASFIQDDGYHFVSGGSFSSPVSADVLSNDLTAQLKTSDTSAPYRYFKTMGEAASSALPGDEVSSVGIKEDEQAIVLMLDYGYDNAKTELKFGAPGDQFIELPSATRAGYTFRGWSDGTRTYQAGEKYTVNSDATLIALWRSNYVPPVVTGDRVNVAETDGGKVSVTPTRADEGDEVTIAATPDEGQEVREVTVTDEDGESVTVKAGKKDGEYVFEMPGSAVTVTVTFGCDGGELCPTHGFNDVDQDAWYHDAVDWAVTEGVLNGYGDGGTSLGPVANVTRAEMAQMLWNQAGRPEADADLSGFTDVSADGWYADALAWCLDEGLFSGYGDTFGTERVISREEAATVLWRLSGSPEADADLSGYGDASSVSDYATGAIEWAVSTGVLTGKGDVALDPQAGCTRGEVAAMMMRMAK
ncbi:S-layer homology domain-containing protein [Thermophilibacter mediterraneus]|uniref:S-layer homology domain-containing protein n=1 Tax=Thermophilibacter mediterraneus TaxID=1871031 RepID=UPI0009FA09BE|nr:S-layer homology domain-containing protein [Thermophilibacter mediterraneus]